MVKKINILLVLLLLLFSIGAVSAADDVNEIVSGDEAIDEVYDLTLNDDGYASQSNSFTVNESNYDNYFDNEGETTSFESGDTITLDGEINNKNFVFRVPVNVVGSDSTNLKNCILTFYNGASGSNISSLKIANTLDYHYGIFLNGANNCVITGCDIYNKGTSSYAICVANTANYNNVTNNRLATWGIREGYTTWSTPPLVVSGAHYNYIANNNISCGDVNGIYLSIFAGGPLKGGNSNFNMIYNNTITYNVLPTSWAYGIQLMGFNNTAKFNKVIGAYLGISGGVNSTIIDNIIINVTGADYNNVGAEVGGQNAISVAANSLVRNNTIINAKIMTTGSGISVSDNCVVENNNIDVRLNGIGISVAGNNMIIRNNNISTEGGAVISNYNGGIALVTGVTVTGNNIVSQNGVGVLLKKLSSKKRPKNIIVKSNTINTTNALSIDCVDVDATSDWEINYNTILNKNSRISTPEGVYDASAHFYEFKGKTYNITPENYDNYIVNGIFDSQIEDGDILSFSGDFYNKYIFVNNAVKITGKNARFFNTTFRVSSDCVWIENLVINNNRAERINAWGVLVYHVSAVTILNCTIDVYDPNAAYTIYVLESSEVDIINNTLSSEGNYLTYTILAHTVNDCKFINNTIFTNGTGVVYKFESEHCLEGNTVCTDGSTVCPDGNTVCPDGNSVCPDGNSVCPDGSSVCPDGNSVCPDGSSTGGSHVLKEVYRTYGILMVYSSDNVVLKNKVRVTSKLNQTYDPANSTNSIVGIDLYYNSHNNVFSENDVAVWGNDNYIYGMGVLGYYTTMIAPVGQGAENNQFINNNINLNGYYCAEGIIIGSSSENSAITGNVIDVTSAYFAYGITLEMSQKSDIKNNNITLNSEIIYGIEAFESSDNVMNNNNIEIEANKAYGIVVSNGNFNEINSNVLFIEINDEITNDNISVKHSEQIKPGHAGIYLQAYSSNNSIVDNKVTIQKGYAIALDEDANNNTISDNYLFSVNGTGNAGVNKTANNTIKDNYGYMVTGSLMDVDIKYLENGTLIFQTDDDNLNGATVEFIDINGNVINVTEISDGSASYTYDFDRLTPASYPFYVKIYKENYKTSEFTCMVNIEKGDLAVSVSDVTGAVARNTEYMAVIKNILGEGVSGIMVEFYVIDEGFPQYVGKAVSDSNGLARLVGEIPKIYDENPSVVAEIAGNNNFNQASGSASLTAHWLTDTKIEINSNVYSKGNLAILKDANGNVLANMPVIIKIGSKTYTASSDSNGVIKMPAASRGTYSISISFGGDDTYYASSKTTNVKVLPSIIKYNDVSVYYGNLIKYKVRVKGPDGRYASGVIVTIKVNGQTYNVKTDKNGFATKLFKFKVGSYNVITTFNGDKVLNKLTFKPTLIAKNIINKKASVIKFSVKVVNKYGKAVNGKYVVFKIKGKVYKAKTNKLGVATANIKNLNVGKFIITSSYGGCTIKNILTVKK